MTALNGRQKAALLLTSLDVATAAELINGIDPATLEELSVEVAYMEACGRGGIEEKFVLAQEFCSSLNKSSYQPNGFLNEMLKSSLGEEKALHVQQQVEQLLQKKDPFIPIRGKNPKILAGVLENEHPQAGVILISELSEKLGSEVLSLLSETKRVQIVGRLASNQVASPQIKQRVAETLLRRITAVTPAENSPEEVNPIRKTAVILRNLSKEVRDGLILSIAKNDKAIADMILKNMIIWEDISIVTDRSLQEALREADAPLMALALHEADEAIIQKVKENVSERIREMIDEESELMPNPKKEDIETARNTIITALESLNSKGELSFIDS